ncbi:MAG: phage tail tape measure protein, partial [Paracoccus sp.]|nr:phage tail tape measure protein [Paracoccus sp. (in: a-proteobacteria)]
FGEAMSLLKDLAVEVWERIRMGAAAAGAAATAMFFDLKADAVSGMKSAIESVVAFGNTAANTFEGAYEAIKAIWGLLPAAIGDLAFQAANSLVDGVEAMLNGVVSRINGFIGGINAGLEALGSERRISLVRDLDLGEIENRFEGAASAATTAAQAAFDRAFEENPLTAPDLGLTEAANRALESANLYRGAARDLAEGARAPLESWQALRDAVRATDEDGADALAEATTAAERFETALDGAGQAATDAGTAAGAAAAAAEPNVETAVTGWQAVTAALSDYASKAREIGGDIGQSLVGAFQSAETAVGEFVKTGKLNFRDLITSLLADLAQLAARRFILGPIANALSGVFSGAGVRGAYAAPLGPRSPLTYANVLHAGGMVGSAGPTRMVPAMVFAAAPRMHSGGMAGLRHDEVPAILQRGERVLSRREAQSYGAGGGVNVTIMARDAESFRQSRTQVAADIARAVSLGRRGM